MVLNYIYLSPTYHQSITFLPLYTAETYQNIQKTGKK